MAGIAELILKIVGKDDASDEIAKVDKNSRALSKSLDGVKDSGGDSERALMGVADVSGFLASQMGLNIGPTEELAGSFAQLGGGIEALLDGAPKLIAALGAQLAPIGAAIAATWAYVAALVAQAAAFIAANAPIILIVAGIGLLVAGIVLLITHWGTVVNFMQDVVVGAFNAVNNAMGGVLDFLSNNWPIIVTLISGPFIPIVALATDAFGIRSALQGAFSAFIGWLPGAWNAVSGIVTGVFDSIVGGAADLWGVKSAVEGAFSAVVGWIPGVWNAVSGFITAPFDAVIGGASDLWGVKSGIETAAQAVTNFVSERIAEIGGFFAGLPGTMLGVVASVLSAATDIGDAIKDGIVAGVKGILSSAADIAGSITDALKSALNTALRWLHDNVRISVPGFDPPGPGSIPGFTWGFPLIQFAHGGIVPGPRGAGDIVPALLSPGEMVLPTSVVDRLRNGGSGRGGVYNVTMHFHGPTNAQDVKDMLNRWFEERLDHEVTLGGRLYGMAG